LHEVKAPPVEAAPAEVAPKRNRRRWALSGALLIVVLAAIAHGHRWWTVGRFLESTDDAYVGGDVTAIAPRVAGFISRVAVTDNQAVRAGDLLVQLDDRDYRAALAKAQAAVDAGDAALANLEATRRLQQARVEEAAARIAATDAEVVRARGDAAFRRVACCKLSPAAQRGE